MKRTFGVFAAMAAMALGACGDSPTEVTEGTVGTAAGEVVITEGIATPAWVPAGPTAHSQASTQPIVRGSIGTPLSLGPSGCSDSQQISITYVISGNQQSAASFKVSTAYQYNGSTWDASSPVTISVPIKHGGGDLLLAPVTVTVTNGSSVSTGASNFSMVPFDLATNQDDPSGQRLSFGSTSTVAVYVEFVACDTPNTVPSLQLPADITAEATSINGAVVSFSVSASDLEDGDLTAAVQCDWTSGDTFPLGTTTVSCSVTDTDGATTNGSFTVTVEDTTPAYFTSIPSGTLTAIAANAAGAVIDLDTFNITVEDFGNVSEPSDYECDYVAGTVLAIGSTTTISCTATDAIGNESAPSTFNIFVGLNVAGAGFLPPLRNDTPFSAHKRGSTIPHKFPAPTYADGTPATDLAGGLRLVLVSIGGDLPGTEIEANDYVAGSTEWRYDPVDGHYIFNLKSQTSWQLGAWQTTVSFAGITLAQTEFVLRK